MPRILVSLALASHLLWGAAAQDTTNPAPSSIDPEKAAIIRQIVEAQVTEIRKRILEITIPSRMAFLATNSQYPAGYLNELERKVTDRASQLDLTQVLGPVLASNFSVDELKQILDFRTSPVGRKLTSLEPEIMSSAVSYAKQWAARIGPEINREIFAEHPEFKLQMEANRAQVSGNTPPALLTHTNNPDDSNIHSMNENGVSPPNITYKREPQYTDEAHKSKIQGSVLLAIVVDQQGVPQNVRVVRSLGYGLDEKAIEAVQSWRFKPAMKDGQPVAVRARVEVNFRLLDHPH